MPGIRQRSHRWKYLKASVQALKEPSRKRVRRCGLRQARYRGLRKTHVQEVLAAVALNVLRLGAYW